MTYAEVIDFLYSSLPVFQRDGASAYKPGLENTSSFNELLGNPDRKFLTVHVAGTNGKGSTSHMLAAILQREGYRTGLFTSPHLKDFRERIRVNGVMIPEREVVAFTEKYRDEMIARGLTFFEMCATLAFDHFAREGVDVAIIETGLGGRLDATNIITPVLSIITNIGFDHMALLGDTLPEIAFEKAGIIKPGVPVVIGTTDPKTKDVFIEKAARCHSEIIFADSLYDVTRAEEEANAPGATNTYALQRLVIKPATGDDFELELDLLGYYQKYNVITVLAACSLLQGRFPISREAIASGCRNVQNITGLRGRWEILSKEPLIICDTGHNEHGIREVAYQLARTTYSRLYFILGVVADKDLDSILPLLPRDAHYVFTQPSTPRARDCRSLSAIATTYGLRGSIATTVAEAIRIARRNASKDDLIFIGGSTFTVADIPEKLDV